MSETINCLTTFAQMHHGVFRRSDAAACGLTSRQIQGLIRSGWCVHPQQGIYRVQGAPTTSRQHMLELAWACGPDAVASHRAAGHLWGLPGLSQAAPEVTRPRGQSQRRAGGFVHGSLWLPSQHLTVRDHVPVTTPARTVFDLAGVVAPTFAERALDAALQRKLCTLAQVQMAFFALARRGRRGTATMRRLLEARGSGYVPPASELERRARQLFEAASLGQPEFEVELGDDDWIGRVDCVWRKERVVVELDGRRFHDGLSARTADRTRDNRLMAAGWRVIRVTWDDLVERPNQVVEWIRRALATAA